MGAWRIGIWAAAVVASLPAAVAATSQAPRARLNALELAPWPTIAASASSPKPKRLYRVAAMGDSLTDPRSHGGKYLEYLAEKCPKSVFDSYGVGGNMCNQMRKRFARDVLGEGADPPKAPYSHVLILGGINDICSDESASRTNDRIKADLTAMYKMSRDHGMQIIALTLPPWGGFARYYNKRRARSTFDLNEWIKKQPETGTVDRAVDIFPVLSCGNPEELCEPYSFPDRVHWSKKGHEIVGKLLHERVFADCL
jgi:lysophospholipase L1-like esterase